MSSRPKRSSVECAGGWSDRTESPTSRPTRRQWFRAPPSGSPHRWPSARQGSQELARRRRPSARSDRTPGRTPGPHAHVEATGSARCSASSWITSQRQVAASTQARLRCGRCWRCRSPSTESGRPESGPQDHRACRPSRSARLYVTTTTATFPGGQFRASLEPLVSARSLLPHRLIIARRRSAAGVPRTGASERVEPHRLGHERQRMQAAFDSHAGSPSCCAPCSSASARWAESL
jgi:hypothetical protein